MPRADDAKNVNMSRKCSPVRASTRMMERFAREAPVTMFLVKGVKLQGIVTWFDNFCLLLRRDGHSQLVYKHAISTIMPGAPIQFSIALSVAAGLAFNASTHKMKPVLDSPNLDIQVTGEASREDPATAPAAAPP